MAKQNFLAGGYYGKLGATVGQRWRNKRTIRTYVKTPNPNTPAQRQNRGRFTLAIRNAQEAMVFNKGAPAWEIPDKTEFQYRTSTAKRRIDAGQTGFAVLPLFPDNYTPFCTISNIQKVSQGNRIYRFTSATYDHTADQRELIIAMTLRNTQTMQTEQVRFAIVIPPNEDYLFEVQLDAIHEFTAESTIFGVSIEDAENSGNMVYIPEQNVGSAEEVTIDDLQAVEYSDRYVLFNSAKLTAIGMALQMNLHMQVTNGLTLQATEIDTVGYFDPAQENKLRVTLPDPYALSGEDGVLSGEVTTVTPGYSITVGESGQGATLGERYYTGIEEGTTDIAYTSAFESEDDAVLSIYTTKGQGVANMYNAKFSYPAYSGGSYVTQTVQDAGSATQEAGTQGLSKEFTLLVTPEHPERVGDKLTIERLGVGGPLFYYGVKNYTIDMR